MAYLKNTLFDGTLDRQLVDVNVSRLTETMSTVKGLILQA